MVKKRMAMRMVTIFVALIVCGMFFPDLARGATEDTPLSVDKYTVEFKDLQLNQTSEIPVVITNESVAPLKLLPQFSSDANCEFAFEYDGSDVSWIINLAPSNSLNINFTYTPSNYGECGAELLIVDMEGMVALATITVTGVLEEKRAEDPDYISVGGFLTSVKNKEIKVDQDTSTLADMIEECEGTSQRHGELVRCIAWTTGELKKEGLLTYQDKRELLRAAAKVEWQRIIQATEKRKISKGSKQRRFWWLHRH
jgi:hypothetical protein